MTAVLVNLSLIAKCGQPFPPLPLEIYHDDGIGTTELQNVSIGRHEASQGVSGYDTHVSIISPMILLCITGGPSCSLYIYS